MNMKKEAKDETLSEEEKEKARGNFCGCVKEVYTDG